jgi:cytochrome c-type biogenesis protein CcmF
VLGWGGYWGWDPVENASLLPWLTGLAMLHSFTVYRRRGGFKKWAVMMSSVTFVLVLLGTFITRSGIIQSVHSFGNDPLSFWWFLIMMGVSLLAPAVLLVFSRDTFKGDDEFTSLLSKESSYYFNNVTMLFAALLVAGLTLSPAINIWNPGGVSVSSVLVAPPLSSVQVAGYVAPGSLEGTGTTTNFTLSSEADGSGGSLPIHVSGPLPAGVTQGSPLVVTGSLQSGTFVASGVTLPKVIKGPTFNAASFDLLARPVGILYVLLMALCPILSWKETSPQTFWKRAKWPLGIAAVLGAGLLAIWATVLLPNYSGSLTTLPALAKVQAPLDHTEGVIGLLVAALAIALPLYLFVDGSRKRASARGESFGRAFLNIMFKSRSQSGGYLTHLGIGFVLVGLIGSSMYVKDVSFTLPETAGAKQKAGPYEMVYRGLSSQTLSNGDVVQTVALDVLRNGVLVQQMKPYVTQLANRAENQSTRFSAVVHSEILSDLFVAFQGGDTSGLSFDVKINPLISWAWFGFGLLILGTAIAAWPRKELPPAPAAPTPTPPVRKKKKRAA